MILTRDHFPAETATVLVFGTNGPPSDPTSAIPLPIRASPNRLLFRRKKSKFSGTVLWIRIRTVVHFLLVGSQFLTVDGNKQGEHIEQVHSESLFSIETTYKQSRDEIISRKRE